MGFCWSFVRIASYVSVALVAVLFFFHLECTKEREEAELEKKSIKTVFRPDETDVNDYPMKFSSKGAMEGLEVHLSLLVTLMPCPLKKFYLFACGKDRTGTKKKEYAFEVRDENGNIIDYDYEDQRNLQPINIVDARKRDFGDFHESGFTLIKLDEDIDITDWRTPAHQNADAQIRKFHRVMEPHIRKLYPDAKRMVWTYNVVRGGDGALDQPRAVDGPHLDYHQNDTERTKFHDKHGLGLCQDPCEARLLLGQNNDDQGEFKVLLGVWKPIHPEKVCDFPLALVDARTFQPEDQGLNRLHFSLGFGSVHILGGIVHHNPKHQWAYFPFQSTDEVLVFHQYSKDRLFANAHSSFHNKNCPEGSEERVSVEMRLALFF